MVDQDNKSKYSALALIFLSFAGLCLLTSLIMNISTDTKVSETLPPSGGLVGPFTIKNNNQVIEVEVKQKVTNGNWSILTAELLDQNKNYLTSFGEELYYQTGYDDEGQWTESKEDYDMKLTVPNKGVHYLRFIAETSATNPNAAAGEIKVKIQSKVASSLPHVAIGIISLIIGVIFGWMGNASIEDFRSYS